MARHEGEGSNQESGHEQLDQPRDRSGPEHQPANATDDGKALTVRAKVAGQSRVDRDRRGDRAARQGKAKPDRVAEAEPLARTRIPYALLMLSCCGFS